VGINFPVFAGAGIGGGVRVAAGYNVERALKKGASSSGAYGSVTDGGGFGGLNLSETRTWFGDGSETYSTRGTASTDRNGFGIVKGLNAFLKKGAPGTAPTTFGDARVTGSWRMDFMAIPHNMLDDAYISLMEAHRFREDVDRRYLNAVRAKARARSHASVVVSGGLAALGANVDCP
jgi:hypothetical protein